jgi:hypothetical protein
MILLTVAFDNKFDQIDEADCMFIFQIKHQYSFCWFYAYVEHIEIKTKTVNIIHFPYLDLSQNIKIRDVPYSLKSPRNSKCKLAHIYGMNKGKVFMPFFMTPF